MAATFFGEVLPVSSRAVEDDDDDDEEDSISEHERPVLLRWRPAAARLEMKNNPRDKISCSLLILAVGPEATGFTQAYILQEYYEVIGGVFSGMTEGDVNTFSQRSPMDKTCYIHRSKQQPAVVVCQCNIHVSTDLSFSWVQQVFSALDLQNAPVIVLSTVHTCDFKSDTPISDIPAPFLRALNTSGSEGPLPVCPYLEQPNVVSGLPAQILTYCQIHRLKAALYLCYHNTIYLDTTTMKMFRPVLHSTYFKNLAQENPKADEIMKQIVNLHMTQSTIYL